MAWAVYDGNNKRVDIERKADKATFSGGKAHYYKIEKKNAGNGRILTSEKLIRSVTVPRGGSIRPA